MPTDKPSRRFLRLRAVLEKTGLTRSTAYALIKSCDFPSPVNIGPRAVGWVEDEIDGWIDHRIASRKVAGTNA
jgi:prophage regulatory protein